jgi:hypothetical protein
MAWSKLKLLIRSYRHFAYIQRVVIGDYRLLWNILIIAVCAFEERLDETKG